MIPFITEMENFKELKDKGLTSKKALYFLVFPDNTWYPGCSTHKRGVYGTLKNKHWQAYRNEATKGYPLYDKIRKYGWDKIRLHDIKVYPEDMLLHMEQRHIDYYRDVLKLDVINTTKTDERGNIFRVKKKVTIYRYDKEGNRIDSFISVGQASKYLDLSARSIYRILEGERKTIGGYHFSYMSDLSADYIKSYIKRAKASDATKLKISLARKRYPSKKTV